MDHRTSLRYNVTGQTVSLYAPQWRNGAPSAAAAYSVWAGSDDNDQAAEFTGTATADAVSTTVDAASGYSQADRRELYLAATTSIEIGDFYLLTDAEGRVERVEVVAIDSANLVRLKNELAFDYTTGDTFVGYKQTFTVDSTFIQDETKINDPLTSPYRVRWRYTIDSVNYEHWTYLDVVEVAAQHNVQASDLFKLWPELEHQEPYGVLGEGWKSTIDAAFDMLTAEMRTERIDMNALRDAQLQDELLRYKTMMLIAQFGLVPNNRDPENYVTDLQLQYKALKRGAIAVINEDKDGGGAIDESKPVKMRLRR